MIAQAFYCKKNLSLVNDFLRVEHNVIRYFANIDEEGDGTFDRVCGFRLVDMTGRYSLYTEQQGRTYPSYVEPATCDEVTSEALNCGICESRLDKLTTIKHAIFIGFINTSDNNGIKFIETMMTAGGYDLLRDEPDVDLCLHLAI